MPHAHLSSGVKEHSRSARELVGSPDAQLPTIRTTLSGGAPRLAWAAMGLHAPMASTTTCADMLSCWHAWQCWSSVMQTAEGAGRTGMSGQHMRIMQSESAWAEKCAGLSLGCKPDCMSIRASR